MCRVNSCESIEKPHVLVVLIHEHLCLIFLDCELLLWIVGYCLVNMHRALKFKFLHTFNSELLSSSNCCGHKGAWVNAGPVLKCKSGD